MRKPLNLELFVSFNSSGLERQVSITPCFRGEITEAYVKVTLADLGRESRPPNPAFFKVDWWSSQ